MLFYYARQLYRVFYGPAAIHPFACRYAQKQRKIFRPHSAYSIYYFYQKTDAVFKAASIFISTLIAKWRQEFIDQIAMRPMYLKYLKARLQCPVGCGFKGCYYCCNFSFC